VSAIGCWSLELPIGFTVASFDFCWMVAASISKGGAGTPGKLTRANDDSNPYDGRQQISMQIAARQEHRTNGCPKNASRCPKNASQTILQLQTLPLKQETNGRRMPTELGIQVQESQL
jgi:hypothetical protein